MTHPRRIYAADIAERRAQSLGWATAGDLALGPRAVEEGLRIPLIHCADFERERALYTLHEREDVGRVLDAPFYYAAQLDHAVSVLSVPFERLEEIDASERALWPCFVFSIGRTGSTLLTRLFNAVGRRSASEPDVFTQVCNLDEDARSMLPPETGRRLVAAGVASLARVLGPTPFIKLRSQCNLNPEALMEPLPGARSILMLRGRASWGLSRHRAFAEPVWRIADILREGIAVFGRMERAGRPPTVIWFEDLVRDPAGTMRMILPDLALPEETLRARVQGVMGMDAQAGSGLARELVEALPIEEGFTREFDERWRQIVAESNFRVAALPLVARLEDQPGR